MTGYDLALVAVTLGIAALALLPSNVARPWRGSAAVFAAALGGAVILGRLPTLSRGYAFNPDEAQMTAQAIAFLNDPVPWRSFDGGSGGPLVSAFVALPRLAGMQPNIQASRFLGILLDAATVIALYALLCVLYGDAVARIGVLLPATFYGLTVADDFVHYSSEQLPMFLFAVALYALARLFVSRDGRIGRRLFATSFVIGLLPFTKLQLVPLAIFAAALAVLVALRREASPAPRRRAEVLAALSGFLTPLALLVLICLWAGTLHDAIVSYVLFAIDYGAFTVERHSLHVTFANEPFFRAYVVAAAFVAAATVVLLFTGKMDKSSPLFRRRVALVAIATIAVVTAAYSMIEPGTGFAHYALLAVVPVALLTASLIGLAWPSLTGQRTRQLGAGALLALLSIVVLLRFPLAYGNPYLATDWQAPPSEPAAMLRRYVRPGERLALWGWMPQYAVVPDAVLGTRDAATVGQLTPSALQEYYRARYLGDIEERRPEFLLDAVAPGSFEYTDRATQGIESFPALARIVSRDYRLVAEADGVRLFKRVRK